MSAAPDTRPSAPPQSSTAWYAVLTRGSVGFAVLLVAIPVALLFGNLVTLDKVRLVGLPVLAILGIMVLFGTLALVAMMFKSMDLSNPAEALALPPGSIRAAISLSLVVLFAIISIMLFQSTSGTAYLVSDVTAAERNELLSKGMERVLSVVQEPCLPSASGDAGVEARDAGTAQGSCQPEALRYTVHLRSGPTPEGMDLAKQLLILVGTLMTSVTSFYFGSRGAAAPNQDPATRKGPESSNPGTTLKPDPPVAPGGTG